MSRWSLWLLATLLLPAIGIFTLVLVIPGLWLIRMSLNQALAGGSYRTALTLENYARFITDPFYLQITLNSVTLSLWVTFIALILSYPIALFLFRLKSRWKSLLLVVTISPLLVSAVVRTYGWIVILGDQGLLNSMLLGLGIINRPLRLINNEIGVIIGLVQILMPYMALALIAGFGRLNPDLEKAAMSLGARPWVAFLRVTLPLSLPGVALGCLLTFALCISSFVTPKLLGGGRVFLVATEIYDQALQLLNWPFAASMSILLLMAFGLALVVYSHFTRRFEWE